VTGKYPPGPDVQVPTYIVNLDLPPEMRWADIAAKHKVPVKISKIFLFFYLNLIKNRKMYLFQ